MVSRARIAVLALAGLVILFACLDLVGAVSIGSWGIANFLALNVLALAIGWGILGRLGDSRPWAQLLLDLGVTTLAVVVSVEMVLGTLGWLRLSTVALAVGLAVALAWGLPGLLEKRPTWPIPPTGSVPAAWQHRLPWGVLAGLALFALAQVVWARWLDPPDTTDALRYHLPFAVHWLQRGDLAMPVPAAGDPSTPFFPLNASLWMAWLILPFQSDIAVRGAQAPFALLAALAAARLAGQMGLPRRVAGVVGLLVATLPELARALFLAESDLILAALLLSATVYLADCWRSADRRSIVLTASTLGLAMGTKTVALPFVAVLAVGLLVAVARGRRSRGVFVVGAWWLAVGGLLLWLGGYSYVRNLVVMGNPLYPMAVRLGDRVLLPGLYAVSRGWKLRSSYYAFDWAGLLFGSRPEFGWTIPIWILPGTVLALWRVGRERHRGALILLLWIAAAVGIFWFVLPYHFARFLYAVLGWAIALAGWGWYGLLRQKAHWVAAAAVPLAAANAVSIPRYAEAWRSPIYWGLLVAVVAGVAALAPLAGKLRARVTVRVSVLAGVLGLGILFLGWPAYERLYEGQRFAGWQDHPGGGQALAWKWLAGETGRGTGPVRIAVAGTDSILPLYGPGLENELLYVGGDGSLPTYDWQNPYRLPGAADPDAWRQALEQAAIDYLYVTPDVVTGEWPQEEQWAGMDGSGLEPAFGGEGVQLWRRQ